MRWKTHYSDRIEQSLAPKLSAQDRRMAEIADQIRERRRQRLQAAGLPFQEEPPPFPPDYHGRRLSIAETIRARREERLKEAAAHEGTAMKAQKNL